MAYRQISCFISIKSHCCYILYDITANPEKMHTKGSVNCQHFFLMFLSYKTNDIRNTSIRENRCFFRENSCSVCFSEMSLCSNATQQMILICVIRSGDIESKYQLFPCLLKGLFHFCSFQDDFFNVRLG